MDISTVITLAVTWTRPWWLLALLAALIPVFFAARRRLTGRMPPVFRVVLQCLAVGFLAMAMAEPKIRFSDPADRPYLLFDDVSASVGQPTEPISLPGDLAIDRYRFAEGAAPADAAAPRRGDTRLGPALSLAADRAQNAAGVILRTDGRAYDDWTDAAEKLLRTGKDVLILPLESPPADGRITDISTVRSEDGAVELIVSAAGNAPRQRELVIRREDRSERPLMRRELILSGPETFRLTNHPPIDREVVYSAELRPADDLPENDRASTLALPVERRIALVQGADGGDWRGVIESIKTPVDMLTPDEAPSTPAHWARWASVVLVDQTGTALDAERRKALAEYVHAGGGLVLIGSGPYRSAADRKDPLNLVSALMANPFEREALKMTVVLDASGSMTDKFDLAIDAVLSLKQHLTELDSLEIVTFADQPRSIYNSGQGPADFSEVSRALIRVNPTGKTDIGPALKFAADLPRPEDRRELVLVLSDLKTQPFDTRLIAKRFADTKKGLAIVATVWPGTTRPEGSDLEYLAWRMNLTVRESVALRGLAEVFAESLRQHRGSAIHRGGVSVDSEINPFGVRALSLPPLSAYIRCAARPDAEVLLRTQSDPVLGRTRSGLGKAVTLAIPVANKENEAWLDGEPGRDLLTAAIGWSMRRGADARFSGRLTRRGRTCELRLDARDNGRAINLLKLTAVVETLEPDVEPTVVDAAQIAPGVYETSFDTPAGPFAVTVRDSSESELWRGAYGQRYPIEYSHLGADFDSLRRIAARTGGRIIDEAELKTLARQWSAGQFTDIWPLPATLGLVLMLVEWILMRRGKKALSVDEAGTSPGEAALSSAAKAAQHAAKAESKSKTKIESKTAGKPEKKPAPPVPPTEKPQARPKPVTAKPTAAEAPKPPAPAKATESPKSEPEESGPEKTESSKSEPAGPQADKAQAEPPQAPNPPAKPGAPPTSETRRSEPPL